MQTSSLIKNRVGNIRHLLSEKSCAEYFAGIGLMRIALEKEGWKVVFANDFAEDKQEMYLTQFPDGHSDFLLQDIHTLRQSSIPRTTLATASFPCNDLSLAGMRVGLGGRESSAYWAFIRILDEMGSERPPIVLLENVGGFLTSHDGRDFLAAMQALNNLGYSVDPLIINAERFVPQSRVRLFVVASSSVQRELGPIRESAAFYESDVRPRALADFILMHPEIDWNLRSLPRLPQRSIQFEDVLEDVPDDSPIWWSHERTQYLISQMSQKHGKQFKFMTSAKHWSYGTVFRRVRNGCSMAELRTDGVAGCLRTPRGGSGRQILVKAGFRKAFARLLTPRECARLMGADDFRIQVSLNQALFGFGDAVCVPVVEWIARHYLNPLVEEMIIGTSHQRVANAK